MMIRLTCVLLAFLVLPEAVFSESRPDTIFKKIRETSLTVLQEAYSSERAFLSAAAARAAGESQDMELVPLLKKAFSSNWPFSLPV